MILHPLPNLTNPALKRAALMDRIARNAMHVAAGKPERRHMDPRIPDHYAIEIAQILLRAKRELKAVLS